MNEIAQWTVIVIILATVWEQNKTIKIINQTIAEMSKVMKRLLKDPFK